VWYAITPGERHISYKSLLDMTNSSDQVTARSQIMSWKLVEYWSN